MYWRQQYHASSGSDISFTNGNTTFDAFSLISVWFAMKTSLFSILTKTGLLTKPKYITTDHSIVPLTLPKILDDRVQIYKDRVSPCARTTFWDRGFGVAIADSDPSPTKNSKNRPKIKHLINWNKKKTTTWKVVKIAVQNKACTKKSRHWGRERLYFFRWNCLPQSLQSHFWRSLRLVPFLTTFRLSQPGQTFPPIEHRQYCQRSPM